LRVRESESGERQGGEEKSIMSSDFLLFGWEESFPSHKKTEKGRVVYGEDLLQFSLVCVDLVVRRD
jgi:hypothetical protein